MALLSLLLNTARIKESRAALVQARRTDPTPGCPAKIEDPFNLDTCPRYVSAVIRRAYVGVVLVRDCKNNNLTGPLLSITGEISGRQRGDRWHPRRSARAHGGQGCSLPEGQEALWQAVHPETWLLRDRAVQARKDRQGV